MSKVYKYFFYLTLSLLLSILITLSFNSNLRRSSLNYFLNAYKVYMLVSIQSDLKKEKLNIDSAVNKISNYINTSKKIAYGKSSLLIGISDTINIIETSVINENDYGKFEEVLKEIVKMDETLFNARISLAKSLFANGKINEAKKEANKALQINPLDDQIYRLLIQINLKENNNIELQNICKNYLYSNLGGKKKRYQNTFFTGFNLNKFSVQLNSSKEKKFSKSVYLINGINLNEFSSYEIVPIEPQNLNNLRLLFNFPPGTLLQIDTITLFSKEEEIKVDEKDIVITSRNSFFLNQKKENIIFFSKYDNEIINLNFSKNYLDIEKISINMKVFKSKLMNNFCE
jgi:hypothetical protein